MKFDMKNRLRSQLTDAGLSSERAQPRADRLEEHVDAIVWEALPAHAGFWVSPRGTLLEYLDSPGKDPSEATLRLSGPWFEVGAAQDLHSRCRDEIEAAQLHGAELERRILAAQHSLNGVH